MMSRGVVVDKLKEWDWTKNIKNDSVRIPCDEPASETVREVRPEVVERSS